MKLNKGDFIRWSDRDDKGEYHWIGCVVSHKNGMVEFENSVGSVFAIPEDDGTFKVIDKPVSWDRERASIGKALKSMARAEKKTTATSHQKKPATGKRTKIDQVVELLTNNPDLINNRKVAIETIVSEIGMTPAGASTYFSNAKKKVALG